MGDIKDLPKAESDHWLEVAKVEVLCDIRYNLDRINQTLIEISERLRDGVTVYSGKL